MTIAVTLLLGAVVVALAAPRVLAAAADRGTDPVVVIVGWLLATAGVLATTVLGLVLMAVPQEAAGTPLAHLVRRAWWSAVAGAPDLLPYRLAAVLAPVLIAAVVARLGWTSVSLWWRARRGPGRQVRLLRALAEPGPSPDGRPVLWLRSERPAAFSVGGRDGAVVLTDGLADRLSDPAVRAVVEHERAHLRGRHHLLIAAAEVMARAFPGVRLLAEAPAALREQVELAADLSAVRRCGPDAVRDALVALTGATTPDRALAMARDAVDVRLRRLARAAEPVSATARLTGCGLFGLLAATPLLVAGLLLLALSVLAVAAAAVT